MSPRSYNEHSFTSIVRPITSNLSPWPFKVMLPDGLPVSGAILTDQIKSIDRQARGLVIAGRAPTEIVATVSTKLQALLSLE